MTEYQVRRHSGELLFFDTLEEAMETCGSDYDKISWTVGENNRLILFSDSTWEYRTQESLRKLEWWEG